MKKRQGLLVVLGLILSGCSYDYLIKDELVVAQQRELFEKLCQSPDRYFVKEAVEVDGYLSVKAYRGCTLGWDPILRHGYRYAECFEQDIDHESFSVQSPVYYFTLEEKGNPKCEAANDFFSSNWIYGRQGGINRKANYEREFEDVIGDRCLAIDVREHASSKYLLYSHTFYIYKGKEYTREELTQLLGGSSKMERAKGIIVASAIKVSDLYLRNIVAQKKEYSFFPKGTLHRTHTVINCDNPVPPWKIEKVLRTR